MSKDNGVFPSIQTLSERASTATNQDNLSLIERKPVLVIWD